MLAGRLALLKYQTSEQWFGLRADGPATWCVHLWSSKVRYVRYTSDLTTLQKVGDREGMPSSSQRRWPRCRAPSNFAAETPMAYPLRYRLFDAAPAHLPREAIFTRMVHLLGARLGIGSG